MITVFVDVYLVGTVSRFAYHKVKDFKVQGDMLVLELNDPYTSAAWYPLKSHYFKFREEES